jgi:hypothetical protein
MNCVMADRDDYIWCDLDIRVNGTCMRGVKIVSDAVETVNNHCELRVTGNRVDVSATLPVSGPVVVLRARSARS